MVRSTLGTRAVSVVPLVAVFVLSASLLLSSSARECVDVEGRLEDGESLELFFDEVVWLEMPTWYHNVYRVDVAGGAGSAAELWTVSFDSSLYCTVPRVMIASEELDAGTTSFEWTKTSGDGLGLRLTPPSAGGGATVDVSFSEIAAPPWDTVFVIPAVVRAPGLHGTFFQTDAWFFNPKPVPEYVSFELLSSVPGLKRLANRVVEAGSVLAVHDVMQSLFGLDEATGALLVRGRLHVTSRTYTTTDSGSYGQFIPAEQWPLAAGEDAIIHGGPRALLHLADSEEFRSNVGLVEVLGLDDALTLEMRDVSGTVLGAGTVELEAWTHRQLNDFFDHLGAPPSDAASITVDLTGHCRYFTYASVVDNRSGDAIFVPGQRLSGGELVAVPAAAAAAGVNGTYWRTDLRVLPEAAPATVEITFYPSDGGSPSAALFEMPTVGGLAVDDVVGRLGGHGSGALVLDANRNIVVTTRTYTEGASGSYGQFIPASWIGWVEKAHGAKDLFAPRLMYTAVGVRRSADFRTNVGMFNPYPDVALDVDVRLISGSGALLAAASYTLEPRRHLQINDVFARLAVPWQDNCRVELEVLQEYKNVLGYASVIDNRSGDAVFVPANRLW